MALPWAQELYQWMENEFAPLRLALEIDKRLKLISDTKQEEYVQYVEKMKEIAGLKVLKQVNKMIPQEMILNN